MSKPISHKVVFISSTWKDLADYRIAVYRAINKLKGYKCIRMEDFPAAPSDPESYIKELIPSCDLFIGIVGLCYGSRPKGSAKSFTELEYDQAVDSKIPCLMFLTPDNFKVDAELLHEDDKDGGWDKQQCFRQRISKDVVRSTFNTPDQLALEVVAAIRNWEHSDITTPIPRGKTDCIILSGGYSQRLWPLTINLSKHLLPVGGKPVLEYALDFVLKSSLINKIFLLTNPKFFSQTKDFFKKYRAAHDCTNVEIIVEPPSTPEEKIGPVGAINYAIGKIKPQNLLIIAGDNIFEFELDEFIRFSLKSGKSSNALYKFESHEDTSEYGVARLSDEATIIDFQEKQAISRYRNISTACYFLQAGDVASLPRYLRMGGNPDSLGSFIRWLILDGSLLTGYVFSSSWFDIGTREKLLQANSKYLIDLRRGQIDNNTHIEGPIQIELASVIKNSRIGPNVYIGNKVQVIDSEIRDSLIMKGSIIRHSSIVNSIVGPESRIEGSMFDSTCGPNSLIHFDKF